MLVLQPPRLKVDIDEITIERFATDTNNTALAASFAQMIIAGLGKNKTVTVKTNAQNKLRGSIDISRWVFDSETFKVKNKSYCTASNTASLTGTYNVILSDGSFKGGDLFNITLKDSSTKDRCSTAKSNLTSSESLIQNGLETAAQEIVTAISPHQIAVSVKLEKGGSDDNALGIDYFVDGLPQQAIQIWLQVAEGSDAAARTAAYYNIGVALEARGDLKSAYEYYSHANSLDPQEKAFRRALRRVEERQATNLELKKY